MALYFDPSRITLARESRSLTLAQLAEKIDSTPQQISQWERGEVRPNSENITKLLNALEAPSTFFFVHSGASDSQQSQQE